MWNLLILYLLVMVVPRILKAVLEGQKKAPPGREFQGAEPRRLPEGTTGLPWEMEEWEEETLPRDRERQFLETVEGEGVSLEWQEEREERKEKTTREMKVPSSRPREKKPVRDSGPRGVPVGWDGVPLDRSAAWAQGVIMAEILLPPRVKRPWRPLL